MSGSDTTTPGMHLPATLTIEATKKTKRTCIDGHGSKRYAQCAFVSDGGVLVWCSPGEMMVPLDWYGVYKVVTCFHGFTQGY